MSILGWWMIIRGVNFVSNWEIRSKSAITSLRRFGSAIARVWRSWSTELFEVRNKQLRKVLCIAWLGVSGCCIRAFLLRVVRGRWSPGTSRLLLFGFGRVPGIQKSALRRWWKSTLRSGQFGWGRSDTWGLGMTAHQRRVGWMRHCRTPSSKLRSQRLRGWLKHIAWELLFHKTRGNA